MTRKTGKMAVKARQLARSAKLARYKRELSHAGVSLSLPKPSAKAKKEKEEELKRLYLELFPKKAEDQKEQGEQDAEREEQAEGGEEQRGYEQAEDKGETGHEELDESQLDESKKK